MDKKWWTSKTMWVNVISLIAIVGQGLTGKELIPLEAQGSILAGINMVLRMVTNGPVVWK
jgi:hypothetical protein